MRFEHTELAIHFWKHRADFAAVTEAEYERAAARFLRSRKRPNLLECSRIGGDLVRYDTATEEFAVLSSGGITRTYFKPVPCVVRAVRFCHGEPDNVQYFQKACKL